MKPQHAQQQIEQLDSARYNVFKLLLASFLLFYIPFIVGKFVLPYFPDASGILIVANALIGLAGAVLLFIALFRLVKINGKIKSDPALREALNNEMYVAYSLRTFQWAFFAMLFTSIASAVAATLYPAMPAPFFCYLIFLVGMVTLLGRFLAIHRDKK